jgi:hypothetical protein
VPAQPIGFRPELPNALSDSQKTGWAAPLVKSMYPWKDTPEKIPLAVRHVRSFLLSNRPA